MTERVWIENRRSEFKRKYGKTLRITVEEYSSIPENKKTLESTLEYCLQKHGASLDKIKSGKYLSTSMLNERAAIKEFALQVFYNKWNQKIAAKMINKDRTTFIRYIKNLK